MRYLSLSVHSLAYIRTTYLLRLKFLAVREGDETLALFVFAELAVLANTLDVRLHGFPKVVSR
jgi:hypothetical protein